MFKINNRKPINRISAKSLKNSMPRNLISVVAIALTAIMITTLFTIGASLVNSFQQATMKQVGTSAHGGFKFISMEQYEKVENDPKVKDISYSIIAGELTDKKLREIYTEFRYTETKNAEWSYTLPTTGTLPEHGMEMATTTDVLDALGVPHELGAKVPLEFVANGKAYQEEFTLCGFWKPDSIVSVNQVFISKEYCDVIAPAWNDKTRDIGLQRSEFGGGTAAEDADTGGAAFEDEGSGGAASDGANEVGGTGTGIGGEKFNNMEMDSSYIAGSVNPQVWFATSWNIEKQMEELKTRCGFGDDVNDGVNWAYSSSEVDAMTLLLMTGLLLLIMFSGYLIIYNVFYISVSSDIRFYGLLKTIGTTGKQLKKIVRRQAVFLSGVGIPVGLILGYVLSIILVPIVIKNTTVEEYEVSAEPLVFAGSALFSFVTVWISCIKPCRLAKKISPIEAVRFAENSGSANGKSAGRAGENGKHANYNGTNEKIACRVGTGRSKGTAGKSKKPKEKKARAVSAFSMAWSNLGRTPKKTVAVVLSISLSLIMLNGTVTVVKGFDMDKFVKQYAVTDFYVGDAGAMSLYSGYKDYAGVSQEDADAFRQMEGVTDFGRIFMQESFQDLEGDELDNVKALYDKYAPEMQPEKLRAEVKTMIYDEKYIPAHVYGADKFIAEKIDLVEGSIDWEKFCTGKYVIAGTYQQENEGKFYNIGDKVKINFEDGNSKEYEVMAIGNIAYALGPQHSHGFDVELTLPTDEFKAMIGETGIMKAAFNVEKEHYDEIMEYVDNYCENVNSDLDYKSKSLYVEEFNTMQSSFVLVGGVLSLILGLIGVLNFINGVITSINARRRELAVLQSIGMTGKQLKCMLVSEGLYHIGLTAVFALTVGNLVAYGVVKLIGEQLWFFSYHFIVWPLFVSLIVFAILSAIIPMFCYRNMCRSSVVDRLRDVD